MRMLATTCCECRVGGTGPRKTSVRAGVTRGGFTLVEMLVSLAVLSLALAAVGVVFSLTTKTVTRTAAYTETHNWVRQFMDQIEKDLELCDPSSSILVMAGRTQAASLSEDDLEAGKYFRVLTGDPTDSSVLNYDAEFDSQLNSNFSNPRADLLMFVTNRSIASQAPPRVVDENPTSSWGRLAKMAYEGKPFSPALVVYGHAALEQARWNGNSYEHGGRLRHIDRRLDGAPTNPDRSEIPANRWHLARRATIIAPLDKDQVGNEYFTDDAMERIVRCEPDTEYGVQMPGDMAGLSLSRLRSLFEGEGPFSGSAPALRRPYGSLSDWPATQEDAVLGLLYRTGSETDHHVATVLEDVPLELRSNLGVHMLPGCVWFQVEFLMPEDPRNSLDYGAYYSGSSLTSPRADMSRWVSVKDGETYIFVPNTRANREMVSTSTTSNPRIDDFALIDRDGAYSVENRRIRMWPYAIRVTVRVYDQQNRLVDPIVRSIVHRFE